MQSTNLRSTSSGSSGYLTASLPAWLGVIGGIWLIVAPFVLNFSNQDKLFYNDLIVGAVAILLFGFYALTAKLANTYLAHLAASGLGAIAGVWLVIAPFILNYTATANAMWSDIVTGAVLVVVGLYTALYHTTHFTDYA